MKVITEWKYVGPPGAAPPTLEKRAKYRGSRKARRARQRLGRPHAYVSQHDPPDDRAWRQSWARRRDRDGGSDQGTRCNADRKYGMKIATFLRNVWANVTRSHEPVYWFARRDAHGMRLGTFSSELEAWEAVMNPATGEPVIGAVVWCESVTENRGWLRARAATERRGGAP